jgi:hypothetical protein
MRATGREASQARPASDDPAISTRPLLARGVKRGRGIDCWWWRRPRRGAPAIEGDVEDELLLLLHVERELAWMKSEIWLVCWSVPKYREGSWLNG